MGRAPCCDGRAGVKKGPWTTEEDEKLVEYITRNGHGSWSALPKLAGLNRCGKSCRLRWTNYLRPDIKRGKFSDEEEQKIIDLHSFLGNKWSAIATSLPGRTDNEIKNYWNTHIRKKLLQMGIDPVTHRPRPDLALLATLPSLLATAAKYSPAAANLPLDGGLLLQQAEAGRRTRTQLLQTLVHVLAAAAAPPSTPDLTTTHLMERRFLRNHALLPLHAPNTQPTNLLDFGENIGSPLDTVGRYTHISDGGSFGTEKLISLVNNDAAPNPNMLPDHVDNAGQVSNSVPPENIIVNHQTEELQNLHTNNNNSSSNTNNNAPTNAPASTIPTTGTTVCESLGIEDLSEELNWKEIFNTAESPTWPFQL